MEKLLVLSYGTRCSLPCFLMGTCRLLREAFLPAQALPALTWGGKKVGRRPVPEGGIFLSTQGQKEQVGGGLSAFLWVFIDKNE